MLGQKVCQYCKGMMNKIESSSVATPEGRRRTEESWVCEDERCHTTEIHIHEFIADDEDTIQTKVNGSGTNLPS